MYQNILAFAGYSFNNVQNDGIVSYQLDSILLIQIVYHSSTGYKWDDLDSCDIESVVDKANKDNLNVYFAKNNNTILTNGWFIVYFISFYYYPLY